VKSWDVIVIGAGIIGLSLAIELNKRGLKVLVVEKGEPGREASWAAGGMLAPFEAPRELHELTETSDRMYPEFVHELEDESGIKIDFRGQGALIFSVDPFKKVIEHEQARLLQEHAARETRQLMASEPAIDGSGVADLRARFSPERSVDPRHLTAAAIVAAKHRGIDFSSGDQVLAIETSDGKTTGVRTNKTRFAANLVVNCAGAWAGKIGESQSDLSGGEMPFPSPTRETVPTRPVKGQMLYVAMPEKELLRHVVRTPKVYLVPRSDGRLLIGTTHEEVGFNKQTVPETIQKLYQEALKVVPKLAEARILEAWAGLRPGTPDNLPILGTTATPGYFVATGHFRDGILLSPVTAWVMGQLLVGEPTGFDLRPFEAGRFRNANRPPIIRQRKSSPS
jgi:glycine oxidase